MQVQHVPRIRMEPSKLAGVSLAWVRVLGTAQSTVFLSGWPVPDLLVVSYATHLPLRVNVHWQATHTHVHKKYVREKDSVFHSLRAFLSANMKMFSLWKPPIGSPQKFSSNWKPDWQTLWTIDRKTSRRRLRGSEIQRGIMFGGAIEG